MSTGLKTLRIYFSYWRRRPWLIFSSLMLGPAFVLQTVVSPLFIAKAIGQLVAGQAVSASYIQLAILSYFGGVIIWHLIDSRISARLDLLTMRDMYSDCFKHLHTQEYSFFVNNFGGSLVSQANRFVKAYELLHVTFFVEALGQFTTVLFALGVMIYYNVMLGLAIALLWFVSAAIVVYMAIRRMPVRRAAVARETVQTGALADTVSNAITIKTFATATYEQKRYDNVNNERHKLFARSWSIGIRNHFYMQLLCGLLQAVLLIGGIKAIQNGSLTIATFLLFQVYIIRIIQSLGQTSLFVRHLEGILGDAHEMTELLERKPLIKDPYTPEKPRINKGKVEFNNVHFDYNENSNGSTLFNNLSMAVNAGERIGLVGPSGGGKTTITRLLLRFHDIESGKITIDDQNIAAISQEDLHRHIAYVPQEPVLFHRSLAENIGYGNPNATIKDIEKAAKRAHAHEFIESLPQGYETLVGERGIKLSGGQRQRVAIARAMLKDAPILLLDEATSALDSESEKLIQAALWELMKHRTAIVIAHRLSTIQRMDRIIVLDEGKVVEEGSHKNLLNQKGLYARLWAHQSGGFLEE